jgi:hypothetical protein
MLLKKIKEYKLPEYGEGMSPEPRAVSVNEFKVSVSSGDASKIMMVPIMEVTKKRKKDKCIDLTIKLFRLRTSLNTCFTLDKGDSTCRRNSSL